MIRKTVLLTLLLLSSGFAIPASAAPEATGLGTLENPVKCQDPEGERWYLSRLRLPSGEKLSWSREGSTAGGDGKEHEDHLSDAYSSEKKRTLFLCMYHPQYVEILAPQGFRLLTEWSANYEYVEGKIHKWGDVKPFTGKIEETKANGIKLSVEVRDGFIQGSLKRHYPDGKLNVEMPYGKENRPEGVESVYHEDGSLYVKYTFRAGVLHGPFEYHPREEGEKEMQGVYENGKMVKEKGPRVEPAPQSSPGKPEATKKKKDGEASEGK